MDLGSENSATTGEAEPRQADHQSKTAVSMPVPTPARRKSSWKALMLPMLLGCVAGVILAMAGLRVGTSLQQYDLPFDAMNGWDLVLLPIWYLLVIGVHEIGHLAGGMLHGMRFLLLIVGPFQFSKTASGIRFDWVFNLGTFGGMAAAMPDPERPLRPQMLRLVAGGPLASLLLTTVAAMLCFVPGGRLGAHGLVVAMMSALIFLVTAVPSRAGGFMSDGLQFVRILRNADGAMTRQRITSLYCSSLSGIRPRDWQADWLTEACRESIHDPVQRVVLRQMAFVMAIDSGRAVEAAEHAEWLTANYTEYPVGIRQVLTVELGLYAVSRGDVGAARQWHAESRGGIVDKSRRALFDAELALAEGDAALAYKHLEIARRFLRRSMDAGLNVMTAERISRLQATLTHVSVEQ